MLSVLCKLCYAYDIMNRVDINGMCHYQIEGNSKVGVCVCRPLGYMNPVKCATNQEWATVTR